MFMENEATQKTVQTLADVSESARSPEVTNASDITVATPGKIDLVSQPPATPSSQVGKSIGLNNLAISLQDQDDNPPLPPARDDDYLIGPKRATLEKSGSLPPDTSMARPKHKDGVDGKIQTLSEHKRRISNRNTHSNKESLKSRDSERMRTQYVKIHFKLPRGHTVSENGTSKEDVRREPPATVETNMSSGDKESSAAKIIRKEGYVRSETRKDTRTKQGVVHALQDNAKRGPSDKTELQVGHKTVEYKATSRLERGHSHVHVAADKTKGNLPGQSLSHNNRARDDSDVKGSSVGVVNSVKETHVWTRTEEGRPLDSDMSDGEVKPAKSHRQKEEMAFSRHVQKVVNTFEKSAVGEIPRGRSASWSEWGLWSDCSATCGSEAKRVRSRFCNSNSKTCPGERVQRRECGLQDCMGTLSCSTSPCLNSGWCQEVGNTVINPYVTFTCVCPIGVSGKLCEYNYRPSVLTGLAFFWLFLVLAVTIAICLCRKRSDDKSAKQTVSTSPHPDDGNDMKTLKLNLEPRASFTRLAPQKFSATLQDTHTDENVYSRSRRVRFQSDESTDSFLSFDSTGSSGDSFKANSYHIYDDVYTPQKAEVPRLQTVIPGEPSEKLFHTLENPVKKYPSWNMTDLAQSVKQIKILGDVQLESFGEKSPVTPQQLRGVADGAPAPFVCSKGKDTSPDPLSSSALKSLENSKEVEVDIDQRSWSSSDSFVHDRDLKVDIGKESLGGSDCLSLDSDLAQFLSVGTCFSTCWEPARITSDSNSSTFSKDKLRATDTSETQSSSNSSQQVSKISLTSKKSSEPQLSIVPVKARSSTRSLRKSISIASTYLRCSEVDLEPKFLGFNCRSQSKQVPHPRHSSTRLDTIIKTHSVPLTSRPGESPMSNSIDTLADASLSSQLSHSNDFSTSIEDVSASTKRASASETVAYTHSVNFLGYQSCESCKLRSAEGTSSSVLDLRQTSSLMKVQSFPSQESIQRSSSSTMTLVPDETQSGSCTSSMKINSDVVMTEVPPNEAEESTSRGTSMTDGTNELVMVKSEEEGMPQPMDITETACCHQANEDNHAHISEVKSVVDFESSPCTSDTQQDDTHIPILFSSSSENAQRKARPSSIEDFDIDFWGRHPESVYSVDATVSSSSTRVTSSRSLVKSSDDDRTSVPGGDTTVLISSDISPRESVETSITGMTRVTTSKESTSDSDFWRQGVKQGRTSECLLPLKVFSRNNSDHSETSLGVTLPSTLQSCRSYSSSGCSWTTMPADLFWDQKVATGHVTDLRHIVNERKADASSSTDYSLGEIETYIPSSDRSHEVVELAESRPQMHQMTSSSSYSGFCETAPETVSTPDRLSRARSEISSGDKSFEQVWSEISHKDFTSNSSTATSTSALTQPTYDEWAEFFQRYSDEEVSPSKTLARSSSSSGYTGKHTGLSLSQEDSTSTIEHRKRSADSFRSQESQVRKKSSSKLKQASSDSTMLSRHPSQAEYLIDSSSHEVPRRKSSVTLSSVVSGDSSIIEIDEAEVSELYSSWAEEEEGGDEEVARHIQYGIFEEVKRPCSSQTVNFEKDLSKEKLSLNIEDVIESEEVQKRMESPQSLCELDPLTEHESGRSAEDSDVQSWKSEESVSLSLPVGMNAEKLASSLSRESSFTEESYHSQNGLQDVEYLFLSTSDISQGVLKLECETDDDQGAVSYDESIEDSTPVAVPSKQVSSKPRMKAPAMFSFTTRIGGLRGFSPEVMRKGPSPSERSTPSMQNSCKSIHESSSTETTDNESSSSSAMAPQADSVHQWVPQLASPGLNPMALHHPSPFESPSDLIRRVQAMSITSTNRSTDTDGWSDDTTAVNELLPKSSSVADSCSPRHSTPKKHQSLQDGFGQMISSELQMSTGTIPQENEYVRAMQAAHPPLYTSVQEYSHIRANDPNSYYSDQADNVNQTAIRINDFGQIDTRRENIYNSPQGIASYFSASPRSGLYTVQESHDLEENDQLSSLWKEDPEAAYLPFHQQLEVPAPVTESGGSHHHIFEEGTPIQCSLCKDKEHARRRTSYLQRDDTSKLTPITSTVARTKPEDQAQRETQVTDKNLQPVRSAHKAINASDKVSVTEVSGMPRIRRVSMKPGALAKRRASKLSKLETVNKKSGRRRSSAASQRRVSHLLDALATELVSRREKIFPSILDLRRNTRFDVESLSDSIEWSSNDTTPKTKTVPGARKKSKAVENAWKESFNAKKAFKPEKPTTDSETISPVAKMVRRFTMFISRPQQKDLKPGDDHTAAQRRQSTAESESRRKSMVVQTSPRKMSTGQSAQTRKRSLFPGMSPRRKMNLAPIDEYKHRDAWPGNQKIDGKHDSFLQTGLLQAPQQRKKSVNTERSHEERELSLPPEVSDSGRQMPEKHVDIIPVENKQDLGQVNQEWSLQETPRGSLDYYGHFRRQTQATLEADVSKSDSGELPTTTATQFTSHVPQFEERLVVQSTHSTSGYQTEIRDAVAVERQNYQPSGEEESEMVRIQPEGNLPAAQVGNEMTSLYQSSQPLFANVDASQNSDRFEPIHFDQQFEHADEQLSETAIAQKFKFPAVAHDTEHSVGSLRSSGIVQRRRALFEPGKHRLLAQPDSAGMIRLTPDGIVMKKMKRIPKRLSIKYFDVTEDSKGSSLERGTDDSPSTVTFATDKSASREGGEEQRASTEQHVSRKMSHQPTETARNIFSVVAGKIGIGLTHHDEVSSSKRGQHPRRKGKRDEREEGSGNRRSLRIQRSDETPGSSFSPLGSSVEISSVDSQTDQLSLTDMPWIKRAPLKASARKKLSIIRARKESLLVNYLAPQDDPKRSQATCDDVNGKGRPEVKCQYSPDSLDVSLDQVPREQTWNWSPQHATYTETMNQQQNSGFSPPLAIPNQVSPERCGEVQTPQKGTMTCDNPFTSWQNSVGAPEQRGAFPRHLFSQNEGALENTYHQMYGSELLGPQDRILPNMQLSPRIYYSMGPQSNQIFQQQENVVAAYCGESQQTNLSTDQQLWMRPDDPRRHYGNADYSKAARALNFEELRIPVNEDFSAYYGAEPLYTSPRSHSDTSECMTSPSPTMSPR